MAKIRVNDIEIEYETLGKSSDKPLLMVMGQGDQLVIWDRDFLQLLVDNGFYVIIYDNRDVGLSTKFDQWGVPNIIEVVSALQKGEKVEVPYTLEDMANDALGLLDALKIEKAHICGISMGGMIVQILAIHHPSRIASMTSIMSGTGNPSLPLPKPEITQMVAAPVPKERDNYIEFMTKFKRMIHGSFPFDEEKARNVLERATERSFYPDGFYRHFLAIVTVINRKSDLSSVKIPALIIHGRDDPVLPVEHGIDTADAIPGSELLIIDGMGHSLPPEIWNQVVNTIVSISAK